MKSFLPTLQENFLKNVSPFWKYILALFLIAFISKLVYFLSHLGFSQDQVRDVLYIRSLIETGNYFIPYGPSTSVGDFYLPPFYYYLHLYSYILFFQSYYSMDFLVIIIESLTPILLFFIIWKATSNKIISFCTSIVYIFSVTVITTSSAGNPNIVPFFGTAFIFSFLFYFLERKPAYFLTAFISVMVLTNLHFQWFVFLPLILILLIHGIMNWKNTWKYFGILFIVGLLFLSTYLIHEADTGFINTLNATKLIGSQELIFERVRKPIYVAFFFQNFFQRVLFGNLFVDSWGDQYQIIETPMVIGSLIFFLIMIINLRVAWQQFVNKKKFFLGLHILMFGIMFLFLRIYKGDKPDYYLYVFISFFFVYLAVFINFLTNKKKVLLQIAPFVVILIIQFISLSKNSPYNDFQAYKKITDEIKKVSEKHTLLVQPTNQQLEIPLTYFLDESYFDTSKKDTVQYYILFCYSAQICDKYEPNNKKNRYNKFSYNFIDPIDFTYYWKNPSKADSYIIREGTYTAHFVRVNK